MNQIIDYFQRQGIKSGKRKYPYIALMVSVFIKAGLFVFVHDGTINLVGTLYINAAKEIAQGNFGKAVTLYRMPAYPILLVIAHIFIPDWIMAGYVVSLMSMVLVTIPLYYFTRRLAGDLSAFWACLLFAVLPQMNQWAFYIRHFAHIEYKFSNFYTWQKSCRHILAAIYLVLLLNLYNFMDGINGIAGIEAITVCAGAIVLFVISDAQAGGMWMLSALLGAAAVGFLFWNFPTARIFMGDAGSGFLGLVLGGDVHQCGPGCA